MSGLTPDFGRGFLYTKKPREVGLLVIERVVILKGRNSLNVHGYINTTCAYWQA